MIKLFITDIDGCLLEPMKTPNWETLARIKALNEQSTNQPAIPPLTICTGRPMPYAEAVAQWMGIKSPLVFESAGVFHPDGYRISINGSFNKAAEQEISLLKKWLNKEIISNFDGMTPEFSKVMDAGLIHPQKKVIEKALPRVREYVEANYEDFEVNSTDVSINIILKSNNKRTGIKKLCELQRIDPADVAFIGDSGGDIPALRIVGRPFAPKNAIPEVKESAERLSQESTDAVLEAYKRIIADNKNNAV